MITQDIHVITDPDICVSKGRARDPGFAVPAGLVMVALEPVELLDHHAAGRERVRLLVLVERSL